VIGDAVNVAARVEGLNKDLKTTLLITEETYRTIQDKVQARDCGELKVKGRHQAVKVYEVLGLTEAGVLVQRRKLWARDGGLSWWPWRSWHRRLPSPDRQETRSPS
jgi:adenylate cyclase